MCNYCHSPDGPAKNKIPAVYFHPREKTITITGKKDFFPLFHAKTGKPVASGNISCPSCHNAHQWDPETRAGGKGVNIEGDVTNSFLRPRSSFELCAECHKKDARLKFEFFHNAKKRKFKSFEEQFFH